MALTNTQLIFLKMVKSGTAPRSPSNKTARALSKQGLIKSNAMFGWILTVEGLHAIGELQRGTGEESA